MMITIKGNDEFFKTPTSELNIDDGRARNTLLRMRYKTIGDVIDNWDRLNNVNGAGVKTIRIIKNAVINYYLETASESKLCGFIDEFRRQYCA